MRSAFKERPTWPSECSKGWNGTRLLLVQITLANHRLLISWSFQLFGSVCSARKRRWRFSFTSGRNDSRERLEQLSRPANSTCAPKFRQPGFPQFLTNASNSRLQHRIRRSTVHRPAMQKHASITPNVTKMHSTRWRFFLRRGNGVQSLQFCWMRDPMTQHPLPQRIGLNLVVADAH